MSDLSHGLLSRPPGPTNDVVERLRTAAIAVCFGLLLCFRTDSAIAENGDSANLTGEPSPDQRFTALVRQLGDRQFTEREKAANELLHIGMPAREQLNRGLRDEDAEVRFRCQRILATILENDFFRRLQEFAADDKPSSNHGLSGWVRFRQIAGGDRDARDLFVNMQKAEAHLLDVTEVDPRKGSKKILLRCQQLQQRLATRNRTREIQSLGSIAALVFIATHQEIHLNEKTWSTLTSCCYQKSMQIAMQHKQQSEPLRAILGKWVRREGTSRSMYEAVMLAMRYNLKDGLIPADRILAGDSGKPWHNGHVQFALLAVAKLGDRRHLPVLERRLDQKTEFGSRNVNGKRYSSQVRDIALAGLFHLAGKDPKQYGFPDLKEHGDLLFVPNSLGFQDDENRQVALEHWKNVKSEFLKNAGDGL